MHPYQQHTFNHEHHNPLDLCLDHRRHDINDNDPILQKQVHDIPNQNQWSVHLLSKEQQHKVSTNIPRVMCVCEQDKH